jgi:hypothetical protein
VVRWARYAGPEAERGLVGSSGAGHDQATQSLPCGRDPLESDVFESDVGEASAVVSGEALGVVWQVSSSNVGLRAVANKYVRHMQIGVSSIRIPSPHSERVWARIEGRQCTGCCLAAALNAC